MYKLFCLLQLKIYVKQLSKFFMFSILCNSLVLNKVWNRFQF
jgi:hypothetical protein